MKFREMNISSKTIDALESLGYNKTTEVQEKTIPLILQNKEVVVRSKTGSGKTAAFGVGLIELISKDKNKQALIMVPTRELAIQITDELRDIAKLHNMRIYSIYGGQAIEPQIAMLKTGFNIVVGTPGRMLDHLRRGTIKLDKINWVVLDEADLMLDMGFEQDINAILDETNKNKQMLLFSATIDSKIKSMAHHYMKHPCFVEIGSEEVEEIEERIIRVKRRKKLGKLIEILRQNLRKKIMIFVATKRSVEYVYEKLNSNGITASYLHGDKTQKQRERTIDGFKRKKFNILVATDVASRGLHIEDVEIIINFDQANSNDVHRHRIGRTGRMGKKGLAITFEEEDPYVPKSQRMDPRTSMMHRRRGYGEID